MPEDRAPASRLEAVFTRIHATRMNDVPILNPRLKVEAVGEREWNDHTLAALITPWFINLMLMPGTTEQSAAWQSLAIGSNALHRFPSGRYEFIVGEERELGRYQMCSLFSPVLEFEDHSAARVAALAALDALFDASLDPDAPKLPAGPKDAPETGLAAKSGEPVAPSRRGLITGRLAPPDGGV